MKFLLVLLLIFNLTTTQNQCFHSPFYCEQCYQQNPHICKTCNTTNTNRNQKCQCINGYYESAKNYDRCLQCHTSCLTCSGPYETDCILCNGSRIFQYYSQYNGNNGRCLCASDSFSNNQFECQKCHNSCYRCAGNKQNCLECKNNMTLNQKNECICMNQYYLQNINQSSLCFPCKIGCLICKNQNQCLSWKSQFKLKLQNNDSYICPIGQYLNEQTLICQKCSVNCLICEKKSSYCTSCAKQQNLKLNVNQKKCVCADGFYITSKSLKLQKNNYCTLCSYKCLTCNQLVCLSCHPQSNRKIELNCNCNVGFNDMGILKFCVKNGQLLQSSTKPDKNILIICLSLLIPTIAIGIVGFLCYRKYIKDKQKSDRNQVGNIQASRYRVVPLQINKKKKNLERNVWSESNESIKNTQYSQIQICSICCLNKINVKTSCNHFFHGQCLDQWKLVNKKKKSLARCPNCQNQQFIVFKLCSNCRKFKKQLYYNKRVSKVDRNVCNKCLKKDQNNLKVNKYIP